jgi:pimeloyl-ACP methyl ester carboxylesterase
MQTVQLSHATIRYRDSGAGRPIVFLHGLLVNGLLWRKVVPLLEGEYRCIVPDLPAGAHSVALERSADRSSRGLVQLIGDFLEALELEDVILVANDSGGALAQLLVTRRPERVGRLVLTPCDTYKNCPPPRFRHLKWMAYMPGALTIGLQIMRVPALRRSFVGFGLLSRRPIPDEILAAWVTPFLSDAGVRRDTAGLLRALKVREMLEAAEKLRHFARPTLLAWAREDRVFKVRDAERLAQAIPDCRLEVIEDCGTFVPEDQPERLAELIAEFAREPVAGAARERR